MFRRLRLTLLLLSFLLSACSARGITQQDRPEIPGTDQLPALESLDALRSASTEQQLSIDPQTALLSANATNAGAGLDLTAPADQNAWALYRVDCSALGLAASELHNVKLSGNGSLWLLLADFADARWHPAGALSEGQAVGEFNSLEVPLSADGFAYFAVLTPAGSLGHVDALLLNYSAPANTFYVAVPQQGGDDANDGSFDHPWATLQHAADLVGPDSLVIVRPGSYQGFSLDHGGEPGAPIVFRAEEGVVVNAVGQEELAAIWIRSGPQNSGYVSIEGFDLLGIPSYGLMAVGDSENQMSGLSLLDNSFSGTALDGIWLLYVNDSRLEGNFCTDSGAGSGILVGGGCDRLTLRGNSCFRNALAGISVFNWKTGGGNLLSSQLLIEANVCSSNGKQSSTFAGLSLAGLTQSAVRNNICYRNFQGIELASGEDVPSTGNLLSNNTVFQDENGQACMVLRNASTGNLLYNNILLHDTNNWPALDIDTSSLPGFDSDYNIISNLIHTEEQGDLTLDQWQALGLRDAHSRHGASINLFESTVEDNYHLKTGALAIDAALADFAPLRDLDGLLRPQGLAPDCGCYEKAGP